LSVAALLLFPSLLPTARHTYSVHE
jgi:hypothetical protein